MYGPDRKNLRQHVDATEIDKISAMLFRNIARVQWGITADQWLRAFRARPSRIQFEVPADIRDPSRKGKKSLFKFRRYPYFCSLEEGRGGEGRKAALIL